MLLKNILTFYYNLKSKLEYYIYICLTWLEAYPMTGFEYFILSNITRDLVLGEKHRSVRSSMQFYK